MRSFDEMYAVFCNELLPTEWTRYSDVTIFKWSKALGVKVTEMNMMWSRAKLSAYHWRQERTPCDGAPAILSIHQTTGAHGYFRKFPDSLYVSRTSKMFRLPPVQVYHKIEPHGAAFHVQPTAYDPEGLPMVVMMDDPFNSERVSRDIQPPNLSEIVNFVFDNVYKGNGIAGYETIGNEQ
jgi:hypothetical protein